MSDDELRRRMHDIPSPTRRIDVDAAIAGARRTRRPKVAALTAATSGAAILIIAPFVVPGLQSFQPTGAGVAEDAGAPAQESGPEQGPGGDESLSEPGAGSALAGCMIDDAKVSTGVVITFDDDPVDGIASVRFTFPPGGGSFEIDGVGVAQVTEDGRVAAAPDPRSTEVEQLRGTGGTGAVEGGIAGPGEEIAVTMDDVALVDAPAVLCGVEGATAPAPVLWLMDAQGRSLTVIGEPFGVR